MPHFDAVRAGVPADLLARAVHSLSVSAEVFLAMRATFARSLSALTVAMHALSIGDRHLDNFLLDTATGRVIGIDFGHAFGSATYLLACPELMGARLTPQLTGFLMPLDTPLLLKGHMTLALDALRRRRADLMRLMEVFLAEPIVDWEAQARRLSAEQRAKVEEEGGAHLTQPPAAAAAVGGGGRRRRRSASASASAGGDAASGGDEWPTTQLDEGEAPAAAAAPPPPPPPPTATPPMAAAAAAAAAGRRSALPSRGRRSASRSATPS